MNNRIVRFVLALILLAGMATGIYKLVEISREYSRADEIQNEMLVYKPTPAVETSAAPPVPDQTPGIPPRRVNQEILDAQKQINSDIVGWLTIPNTNIDYLFVQASDDNFYLRRDLNKRQASAGSIFMDSRNSSDFSDFNTILYGHNMKNGSMFHNLRKFADKDFFDGNRTGTIFLADRVFSLQIFAYLVTGADNAEIYQTVIITNPEKEDFFDYIRDHARQYRDIGLTAQDRIVTLSTCAYEYDDARMVLLAQLVEI